MFSNAAVFAQLGRVPRVISAGSRVWQRSAQLQNKPAEESLDAFLSLSFPFSDTSMLKRLTQESVRAFELWENR